MYVRTCIHMYVFMYVTIPIHTLIVGVYMYCFLLQVLAFLSYCSISSTTFILQGPQTCSHSL